MSDSVPSEATGGHYHEHGSCQRPQDIPEAMVPTISVNGPNGMLTSRKLLKSTSRSRSIMPHAPFGARHAGRTGMSSRSHSRPTASARYGSRTKVIVSSGGGRYRQ